MPEQHLCSYGAAIYEALDQEMAIDPEVLIYGLGVDDPKGHYGTTKDLHLKYGAHRCFDMPLSEDAMTGVGIGMALNGMRPVYVHQRMDFLLLCMNQLVNMAAKIHYMSNGESCVPLVVRASIGRSWGQGAQHSQALHSYFMHVPGLRVVAPSTPFDAKTAMTASIRDNNPVVYIEHRMLYANEGLIPTDNISGDIGKARVLKKGKDITIVAISHMVVEALRAATLLSDIGIEATVIDPVWLSPLDTQSIMASVQETSRLLVVDNGWLNCGASSEIIAQVAQQQEVGSDVICYRLGYAPSTCPTTPHLEQAFYPSPQLIAETANKLCNGSDNWQAPRVERQEIEAFKGPF